MAVDASAARPAGALGWKGWLQERQYATPYHWRQPPNDEREYRLRTTVVFTLAGLTASDDAAYLRSSSRPRLLDVGCGDARFAADATLRADVTGVDVSKRALGHARELAPLANFSASCASALPFRSNSFDVVTVLDVIEHVPDADEARVIAEACRVLRPGGRLIVSTNTDRSACELKHYRHYSIARFRSLFAGLQHLELAGIIPYFPTLKVWMAAPVVWRLTSSRIRTCPPEDAHVVVGVATKP